MSASTETERTGTVTLQLLFAVIVITFGSSFQFGYNLGVINAPGKIIQNWMNETHFHRYGSTLSHSELTFIFSISVALFALGAMLGGWIVGWLADRLGRRRSLHLNNLLSIAAAFMMMSAKYVNIYPLFHLGRFFIGVNAGIASGLVPIYVTELSPIKYRGAFGSVPQFVVTLTILLSAILGLPSLLGTHERWPLLFAVILIPSFLQIILLFWVVESPKYTLLFEKDSEKALNALCKIRGNSEVAAAELKLLAEENTETAVSISFLFNVENRWPMILGMLLMGFQQLSGINAAMFYSTEIFTGAGLNAEMAVLATIGMGVVNVITTGISVRLVDLCGRRVLLIVGKLGMAVSSILLTSSGWTFGSLFSAFLLPLYVVFFAIGPGSIPFFYISEIFGSESRASASAVGVTTNWTCNFLVGLFFLPLNVSFFLFAYSVLKNLLREYTFLVFATFCLVASFVIWRFLAETKGKTVAEAREELCGRRPPFL